VRVGSVGMVYRWWIVAGLDDAKLLISLGFFMLACGVLYSRWVSCVCLKLKEIE
jgi:hypothetical protein